LAILWRGMARGGSWVVLSSWLWFWWVLIAAGSACLCRRCAAGNGAGGWDNFRQGRGWGLETFSSRARGGNMSYHRWEFFHRAESRRWSLPTSHRHYQSITYHQGLIVRRCTRYMSSRWALPRPAGPQPIFCLWANANGPERTVCVGAMRQPTADALMLAVSPGSDGYEGQLTLVLGQTEPLVSVRDTNCD
jgi:hypothetical protein